MDLLWVRHARARARRARHGRARESGLTAAGPRAGRAARRLARARTRRRGAVEPAAPRDRDRNTDRGRARPRVRDRRRPRRVRRAGRPLHPDGGAARDERPAAARHGRGPMGELRRRIDRRCSGHASAKTIDEIIGAHPGRARRRGVPRRRDQRRARDRPRPRPACSGSTRTTRRCRAWSRRAPAVRSVASLNELAHLEAERERS